MSEKKKRKPKKNRHQPSRANPNKKLEVKIVQTNKVESPKKGVSIYQSILRYRKWIPPALIFFLFSTYILFYPKKITIKNELLGQAKPFADAIIFTNPNSYELKNIKINGVTSSGMIVNSGNIRMHNIKTHPKYFIKSLPAKKSKHISLIGGKLKQMQITELTQAQATLILSYKTPFIYPNIKNDTFSLKGVLNTANEVIYLPE